MSKDRLIKTTEGVRYYVDDPQLSGQRIVLRAWPSSWNPNKWVLEAFAEYDCQVELAVLPISSPCGSAEADELTKLLLTERGARIFSQGKRVFNDGLVPQTLRERLHHETCVVAVQEFSRSMGSIRQEQQQRHEAKLADWRKRLESLQ